jgi:hypothetical protein
MHALNGNIDHPQQIDINAFPARPFLPIVIEKITASRINTPTPSSTTIADFENELAKTNPDSAASLQRDAITPNKKSKKKNKNKKKIAPPPSNANATVVHFNMNLGGVESAIQQKIRKQDADRKSRRDRPANDRRNEITHHICRRNRVLLLARFPIRRGVEPHLEVEKDEEEQTHQSAQNATSRRNQHLLERAAKRPDHLQR